MKDKQADFLRRAKSARQVATELFETDPKPDWVTFFQEIMGVDGTIRRLFPDPTEIESFHKTPEFQTIQKMLGQLRSQDLDPQHGVEATQMITPRLPKCLHRYLQAEVEELRKSGYKISLNGLAIVKLCVPVDVCMLPPPENH